MSSIVQRLPAWLAAISSVCVCCAGGGGENDPAKSKDGVLEITDPRHQAIISNRVFTLRGTAKGVESVHIDGVAVAVSGEQFETIIRAAADGRRVLRVEAGTSSAEIVVVIDTEAPSLNIRSPLRGSFAADGAEVRVEGAATDSGSGVDEVLVAGVAVQVDAKGNFSSVPSRGFSGLIDIEVRAADKARQEIVKNVDVLAGHFRSPGTLIEQSVMLAMTDDILNLLVDELLPTFTGLIPEGGVNLGALTVDSVAYRSLELDFEIRGEQLLMSLRLTDVFVELTGYVLGLAVPGSVSASVLTVRSALPLRVSNGALAASIQGVTVEPMSLIVDLEVDPITAALLEPLAVLLLPDLMVAALEGVDIGEVLSAKMITDALNTEGSTDAPSIDARFGTVAISNDTLLLGMNVSVSGRSVLGQDVPGSLANVGGVTSSAGAGALRLSLADDFLNALLFALWRSGAFNLDVGALLGESASSLLSSETFSGLLGPELLQHFPPGTPMGLVARPSLPPVVHFESPSRVVLELGDLLLDALARPAGGSTTTVATIALSAEVGLELSVSSGMIVGASMMRTRADLDDEPLFDMDDQQVESTIESLIESLGADAIGDLVTSLLADLDATQLIPGVMLSPSRIATDDAGDFLTIELSVAR